VGDHYLFTHLQAEAGMAHVGGLDIPKTGAWGHADYPRDALNRMTGFNLAAILLNRPDLAVKVSPH
jgi:hypothetical protein